MADGVICNRPLTDDEVAALNGARIEWELNEYSVRAGHEPISPVNAYIRLFYAIPDSYIERSIRRLYKRRVAKLKNRPGYVYVCWDRRDDPSLVKIGSTEHTPDRRLTQWRRELGADAGELVLLFAFQARSALFSELVLHEVLRCERIVNRVNRRTGHRLTEYFRIHDVLALRALATLTVRHSNWFVQQAQLRRK